jgi:signal transduction histidine kinase
MNNLILISYGILICAILAGYIIWHLQKTGKKMKDLEVRFNQKAQQLRRVQEQLAVSEKMASLGSLVADIAHEINTPVGIGVTAVSTLREEIQNMAERYDKDELTRRGFQDYLKLANDATQLIQHNLERTAELIGSVKQVSADQASEKKRSFMLRSYLEDIIRSFLPKCKPKKIVFDIVCDECLELTSYPGAYAQIFTNLLLNSCMHGFHNRQHGKIGLHVFPQDGKLRIEYFDDGTGIHKNDLPHIFEPFYTTDQSRGTGLGLNIVYNLVKQKLQGSVSCVSEPGKGVRFILELPETLNPQTHGNESAG